MRASLKLEQALISVAKDEDDFLSEKALITYGKIKRTYTQQKRVDGAGSGNVIAGRDLTARRAGRNAHQSSSWRATT
jgi:type VI secretion system secreted protein Hcp